MKSGKTYKLMKHEGKFKPHKGASLTAEFEVQKLMVKKVDFEQYYVEASLLLASVLGGLALKDYSVSFIKGLKFN